MHTAIRFLATAAVLASPMASPTVQAHGDVTPQAVDVSTLNPLGEKLREENPYRGDKEAIRVGASAYNQNCARCHGIEAVSGGIAPDLRKLDIDQETDGYFLQSILHGKVRNGAVYMPPFEGIFPQEAIWAIRSYLDTRRDLMSVPVSSMEALAKKSGCLACHAVDRREVGPGYREVARKYAGVKDAEAKLLAKVKNGGVGVWGKVPMPPMGSASDQDIQALVKWIVAGAK